MVDPINLRQIRKRKMREEKEKQAEANRQFHGVSSKLKKHIKQDNLLNSLKLDGKKRKPEA
ncbi:MAG: DUF4169 family protein [Pseudomonadota bacterium]